MLRLVSLDYGLSRPFRPACPADRLGNQLKRLLGGPVIGFVQREIGKDAIINERINKDMLGGIVMTVQGKRIDASVRAQLNKARIELKKNTMEVKASD